MCKNISIVTQAILIYFWLNLLQHTDSVYSIYLFCGEIAIYALWTNARKQQLMFGDLKSNVISFFVSAFFALCVALSNWRIAGILTETYIGTVPQSVLDAFVIGEMFLLFISSIIVFWNISLFLFRITENKEMIFCEYQEEESKGLLFRNIQRIIIITVPCVIVLFLFDYPGTLTLDSIVQIDQIFAGNYSNHHPFYHTMFIKAMLDIGMKVFKDINAAVALYSVVQLLIGAFSFTFVLSTMERIGVRKNIRLFWLLWFIIMPYNVVFSITMWKDVIFAYAAVVVITVIYRLFRNVGNELVNYSILGISGIVFCLFRSNGFFAFVIMVGAYIVLFHKKSHLKVIAVMLAVIGVAFVLKYPVLKTLNVSQPRTAEGLSIPEQQIARVIADGKELTDEERELINKVIDIDKVPELYLPNLSDPIKFTLNDEYLTNHKREYLELWAKIGVRYPTEYVLAWVEQTKGYWNGGYDSAPYTYGICENNHGIEYKRVNGFYLLYMQLFRMPLMGVFVGNGFNFWVLCLVSALTILRKKKEETFLAIPVYAVWLSLLVATPQFDAMRYIYALYICLPFIITVSWGAVKVHTEV